MKNKHLVLIVALCVTLNAFAYDFSAITPSGHTLYYDLIDGGAEVAKCNYNYPNYGNTLDGDLIIPDSVVYNGVVYPVISIGFEAFEYATMRSVQIPNTVRTIIIRAFSACDSLTSLVIPNSVTSIGLQAFAGSFNITSIVLPDSLTVIEQGIFENDTSLLSIIVPDAVISVGYGAFSQCYSLRSVTFGTSVVSIGGLMFWNCRSLDSLIFTSDVAPSVGNNLFYGAPDSLTIIAPCGSYHSYLNALGPTHSYIVPAVNLTMTASSAMPDWGTATIIQDSDQQNVRCDSSVVIQAQPNYGYHFVNWSNGSTANPDTLFLDRDSSLTASFAKNQYTVTVLSSNTDVGTVSGGGTFDYLDTTIFTATAVEPYHFVRWNDGNTQNPRTVVVNGDMVRTAIFGIDTFTVSLQVDSVIHGTCTGFGSYPYGSAASVVAVPYSGYQFSHWSDGSTYNPYTFAVVNDIHLTAYFYANGTPYQDTLILHDTTYIDVPVHDTTYIDVPYAVHDTAFINNYIHDTVISYINHYVHDTTFINNYIHDTTYVTVPYAVHDTTFVNNYIHDTVISYINHYVHDTTFINNYIHDTLWLTEYLHDTIYLPQYIYDTIYIHDTVYITEEGIDDMSVVNAKIYQRNGQVVVEGAEMHTVTLYDAVGRLMAIKQNEGDAVCFDIPVTGIYLIKIGTAPARRIVVVK